MSRQRRQKQRDRQQQAEAVQRHPWIKGLAILLTVAAVASVVVALNLPKPAGVPASSAPEPATPKGEEPAAPRPTPDAPAAAEKAPDFQKLLGRWLRTNGPYELLIRSVDDNGKIVAAYINPQGPIHVSKADASKEGSLLKLFIELRDAGLGYPGCTYRLTYNPQQDQLQGVYYQAAMRETHDVAFERQP